MLLILSVFISIIMMPFGYAAETVAAPPVAEANTNAAPAAASSSVPPAPQKLPEITGARAIPLGKIIDENLGKGFSIRPDEDYVKPTWSNLVKALVRARALDLSEDNLLVDEFASITECELYTRYYENEFQWEKVRKAIRESTALNKEKFPLRFTYSTQMQLDRYDYTTQTYRFRDKSIITRANVFRLYDVLGNPCHDAPINALPRGFRGMVNDPITIKGISLTPKAAETFKIYMDSMGNTDRILFAKFDLTMKYVMPIRKELKDIVTGQAEYVQGKEDKGEVRMDMVLDRIRFYSDEAETTLVYTLKP